MANGLAFLGLQDAARKRRMPSQTPGAWAGATVSLDGTVVRKGVMKECWGKVKSKIRWIANEIVLSDEYTPDSFGEVLRASREKGGPHKGSYTLRQPNRAWGFWFMWP